MTVVRMRQCPVGQGGFAVGAIIEGDRVLRRWAYDCGSNQWDPLVREISRAAHDGEVDTLYLSHMDLDHVNGVDLFLHRVGAREAVIPYISEEVRVAIVAAAAWQGTLTRGLVELINDPADWFSERGCPRVVSVDYANEDGENAADVEDSRIADGWSWTHALRPIANNSGIAPAGAVFRSASLDWVFAPYAHRPKVEKLKAFHDAVTKHFYLGGGAVDIADIVRTKKNREVLADLYEDFWLDTNLVSLSLYCGPSRDHFWRRTGDPGRRRTRLTAAAGWMSTGDANLIGRQRLAQFVDFYRSYSERVGVLVVPHHGSARSSDERLVAAFPHLTYAVAAAGPNKYGHPHRAVEEAATDAGVDFLLVNDHAPTALDLSFEF